MFIAIERKTMTILYKHPNLSAVLNLVYLEYPHGECYINHADKCLDPFSDLELRLMYRTVAGEGYIQDVRSYLYDHIWNKFDVTNLIPAEVEYFASTVDIHDKSSYKYVKGQFTSHVAQIIAEQPKLTNPNTPYVPFQKKEREPREASGTPNRPRPGSSTGMVWDIADKLESQYSTDKELRKAVIEECTQQGINSSTASVQFGKWRAAR